MIVYHVIYTPNHDITPWYDDITPWYDDITPAVLRRCCNMSCVLVYWYTGILVYWYTVYWCWSWTGRCHTGLWSVILIPAVYLRYLNSCFVIFYFRSLCSNLLFLLPNCVNSAEAKILISITDLAVLFYWWLGADKHSIITVISVCLIIYKYVRYQLWGEETEKNSRINYTTFNSTELQSSEDV